jgi:hypothetical protein
MGFRVQTAKIQSLQIGAELMGWTGRAPEVAPRVLVLQHKDGPNQRRSQGKRLPLLFPRIFLFREAT